MAYYSDVKGRWKVAVVCSIILSLFVFTPLGLEIFGLMLPAVWLALAIGVFLFAGLSFAAKEEKRRRSLIAAALGVISLAYVGIAWAHRFDAYML